MLSLGHPFAEFILLLTLLPAATLAAPISSQQTLVAVSVCSGLAGLVIFSGIFFFIWKHFKSRAPSDLSAKETKAAQELAKKAAREAEIIARLRCVKCDGQMEQPEEDYEGIYWCETCGKFVEVRTLEAPPKAGWGGFLGKKKSAEDVAVIKVVVEKEKSVTVIVKEL